MNTSGFLLYTAKGEKTSVILSSRKSSIDSDTRQMDIELVKIENLPNVNKTSNNYQVLRQFYAYEYF